MQKPRKNPRIILYELNEVPWAVIDYYTRQKKTVLGQILSQSTQLTTFTKDTGELHPWVTWPTVHRGVYNDIHKISFINQEILDTHKPLWELIAKEGLKVGVFGSLQSWPVPSDQEYAFYIPDTFAQDHHTHPAQYEVFQRFNLAQVKRDGAVARADIIQPNSVGLYLNLIKTGLKISTAQKVGWHLLKERINPVNRTFRSALQGAISFDYFQQALSTHLPDFATFFTNHVAGIMHRYWKYTFPQDFGYTLQDKRDHFLAQNIMKAMDIVDHHLKYLRKFCQQNDAVLVIASSMGQEDIDRGKYIGELRIENFDLFYKGIGYTGLIKNNLAMQPDFAFSFESLKDLQCFQEQTQKLTNEQSIPIFRYKVVGHTLNLSLTSTHHCIEKECLYREGKPIPLKNLGIEVLDREQGTGYHQPRGVAIFYGQNIPHNQSRQQVESIQLAPTILKLLEIKPLPYMAPPIELMP